MQEIRGNRSASAIAQFGEKVMFMPAQTASGKLGKLDDRYYDGIFLGMRLRSDEILIGTEHGVIKARSICRHPEGHQWDKEAAKALAKRLFEMGDAPSIGKHIVTKFVAPVSCKDCV